MVVQLAVSRSTCNTLGIPIAGDPPPAILLQLKLHESSHDNAHSRTLGIGVYGVLFTTGSTHRPRGRHQQSSGEGPRLLRTAAAVNDGEGRTGAGSIAAITIRYCARSPRASNQPER